MNNTLLYFIIIKFMQSQNDTFMYIIHDVYMKLMLDVKCDV